MGKPKVCCAEAAVALPASCQNLEAFTFNVGESSAFSAFGNLSSEEKRIMWL